MQRNGERAGTERIASGSEQGDHVPTSMLSNEVRLRGNTEEQQISLYSLCLLNEISGLSQTASFLLFPFRPLRSHFPRQRGQLLVRLNSELLPFQKPPCGGRWHGVAVTEGVRRRHYNLNIATGQQQHKNLDSIKKAKFNKIFEF